METKTLSSKTIKSLSEDDRPREKMLLKGKEALSNAELLAILLGSGNKTMNAVELAQLIFEDSQNQIHQLARLSIDELTKFSGVGPAKAVTISAALELGRRRKAEQAEEVAVIKDSQSAYQILEPYLADLPIEEFWVLFLNQRNQVIRKKKLSIGGISATVVDQRLILKEALLNNASGFVLGHNHPSGNLNPSREDIHITNQLKESAQIMSMRLLDHIIISNTGYFSFLDEGLL